MKYAYIFNADGPASKVVLPDYKAQDGEVLFEGVPSENQLIVAFPAYAAFLEHKNIKAQISALEATQTPRRIREALTDPTWMEALDVQIAALRAQLT